MSTLTRNGVPITVHLEPPFCSPFGNSKYAVTRNFVPVTPFGSSSKKGVELRKGATPSSLLSLNPLRGFRLSTGNPVLSFLLSKAEHEQPKGSSAKVECRNEVPVPQKGGSRPRPNRAGRRTELFLGFSGSALIGRRARAVSRQPKERRSCRLIAGTKFRLSQRGSL